jgi:hypothetical protein
MTCSVNDFIIKGIKGEYYACKPDIFELTYDLVEEVAQVVVTEAVVEKVATKK